MFLLMKRFLNLNQPGKEEVGKMALLRSDSNPVLSARDIPFDASLIFNAGVCKFNGKYVMVFRNDVGFSPDGWTETRTNLGVAWSDDGIKWHVQAEPWKAVERIVDSDPEICRFYDPRLTVIDGRCYLCFAVDTRHGVRGGIAVTDDFDNLEVLSMSAPDNRNMVLFPEKIDGKFLRLERPFPEYSRGYQEKFDIWSSKSPDCRYWGETELVLATEHVPYANAKIGPAAPPVKTGRGWLCTFHATSKDPNRNLSGWETANNPAATWNKEYFAGLMLLDLENPEKVIGLMNSYLLTPETDYERFGVVPDVVFTTGAVVEPKSRELRIYYGGADTCVNLATGNLDEIVENCLKGI